MGLRITSVVENDAVVLGLHGWLEGAEVAVFEETCGAAPLPLQIDLSWLVGADASGISALRRARERGAGLRGASPYVRLLLRGDEEARRALERSTRKPD